MITDQLNSGALRGAVLLGLSLASMPVACATPDGTSPAPASPPTHEAPAAGLASRSSSIDPALQIIADEEIDRVLGEWQAPAGAVLVLDPRTGEIRASAGRAHGARADLAVAGVYVTGSTMKAVTLAAALDDGIVAPTDSFDCEHGSWTYRGKVISDSHSYGMLTLPQMLAVSSNIGFAKLADRLGGERLESELRAFRFGVAPPVDGAAAGSIPDRIEDHSPAGVIVAIGETVTASPLQVAAAYGAIANGGAYVAPTLSPHAGPTPREPIMKPETARAVTAMLEEAVNGELATGKLARVAGARVAGKTGTASWDLPGGGEGIYASFVGFVPSTAPRYVIVVGVEQPKGEGWGGNVAAPAFARVASRALAAAR